MECSICLELINDNDKKVLSCNHSFHANCYLKCVKTNNYNSFIKCPLCREINMNTSLPFSEPKETLELLHERKRCKGITKNGTRCKCKSSLFSRYCHNHEKILIDKKDYDLLKDYIEWLFLSQTSMKTKISMVHLFKHLLNKEKQKNNKITLKNIHYYYFRFFVWAKENSLFTGMNEAMIERFCEYYELEDIDIEWIKECKENESIFV